MDLDFGVKTWYLRPTFLIRVLYIIVSVGITIHLFVACSLLSDDIFEKSVTKLSLVLASFLAISMIISLIFFILFIFKIVPEYQYISLLVTLISSVVYMILCIIFTFTCCSDSKCNTAQEKLSDFLNKNTQSNGVKEFISKNNITMPCTQKDEAIIAFCKARTTGLSKGTLGSSIAWLIVAIIVYYSLLYTGQVSKLIAQNDKENEKKLTDDVRVDI